MAEGKVVWTPVRLEVLLRVVCSQRGVLPRTRAQMAHALGVHPSTLRRWGKKGSWRSAPAAIPPARLEGFLAEVRPSGEDLRREEFQIVNALGALERLRERRVPLPAWKQQGWLLPHRVWVESFAGGLSSVRLTRVGTRRDRGEPGVQDVRALEVATRFDAQLLKGAVLREVGPWRVRSAGISGGSERWVTGAALRPLEVLMDEARSR